VKAIGKFNTRYMAHEIKVRVALLMPSANGYMRTEIKYDKIS